MPVAELALGALVEALKLVNSQLASKLEREMLDILKREKEGKDELAIAEAAQYPHYSDFAVKEAELKIKQAQDDGEKFKDSLISVLKPYLEAKK